MILECGTCGTLHDAITRAQATELIKRRLRFDTQDPPDITDYEHCSFCGSDYKDFNLADFNLARGGRSDNYIIDPRSEETNG